MPSVPALRTVILRPAILSTHESTNAEFLPPIPLPVTGKGIGGRNSAFVLSCVDKIAGRKITVLSAGTDGMDGNSPAAGAVADGETLARAKALGLNPATAFQQSDAYTFVEKLGDALLTGPTGNNLRDLRILLAEPYR